MNIKILAYKSNSLLLFFVYSYQSLKLKCFLFLLAHEKLWMIGNVEALQRSESVE